MWRQCAMVLCVMHLMFSGVELACAGTYFTNLGFLPDDANSQAAGINNAGQVVGTSWVGAVRQSTNTAWMYDGTMQAISGPNCYGFAIDSTGKAVGSTTDTGTNPPNPYRMGALYTYSGSSWTTTRLAEPSTSNPDPPYELYASGEAYAIHGNVAGGGVLNPSDALLWDITNPSAYTDLRTALVATLGAGTGPQKITGINSTVAVGQFMIQFNSKGFIYNLSTGALTEVPTLGGNNCYPNAVNAGNLVVGAASEGLAMGKAIRAMKYDGTTITDLGAISEGTNPDGSTYYSQSRATAVNSNASIVGFSYLQGGIDGPTHAFFWDSVNGMKDLNVVFASVLPSGWVLSQATGINDNGWIVGYGDNGSGATSSFLLKLLQGDADLNGTVNISDLSKVLTNYDKTGTSWGGGDFNADGTVDITDLSKVLTNYDKSMALSASGIKAVPEPGTLALLAAALIGLVACTWRRHK